MLIALPVTAWGLERLLQLDREHVSCVGVVPTVSAALREWARMKPDVIVVDLDGEDGPDALVPLRAATEARLLVLASASSEAVYDGAVLSGARGVVQKRDSPESLLKAVAKVHRGELWIERQATGRIFMELARQKHAVLRDPERDRLKLLTPREMQMVVAMAADAAAPGKVLAQRLHISENTLRNHLTSVYSKLGVANRMELYVLAHRLGVTGGRAA
jgi:two-component system, NarL family, nitrate/nitrite response regulator NarL